MTDNFAASLPELTDDARATRSQQQAHTGTVYTFFKHQGKIVLCNWDGQVWGVFGEVPDSALTKQQADSIIAAVAARDSGGSNASGGSAAGAPDEWEHDITTAVDSLQSFVDSFRTVDHARFAFDPSHDEHLAKVEKATESLWNAARTSPFTVAGRVFSSGEANPVRGGASNGGNVLALCAEFISLITSSIENMVLLDASMYSSEVLVQCGKVRLQLLRMLQCVASNESATRRIVELSHQRSGSEGQGVVAAIGGDGGGGGGGAGNSGGEGDATTLATTTVNAIRNGSSSLEGAIIGVLHAMSAKFDFVAVQVATNLLRNWALFPDEEFRRRLIEQHRALSALANLVAHKDANVAGTAIATLRHVCSTRGGNAVQHLVRAYVAFFFFGDTHSAHLPFARASHSCARFSWHHFAPHPPQHAVRLPIDILSRAVAPVVLSCSISLLSVLVVGALYAREWLIGPPAG
jgi:hypothetical protein